MANKEVPSPGLGELLPPSSSWEAVGMCGYTGEARDRSLGSTTKIRLPEHKGDDMELKDTIEDHPLR